MKHIFVVGATGGTGLELVRDAVAEGHSVTALVRDRARLPVQHRSLTVLEGNVLDQRRVADAMAGCGAVICTLGVHGRPNGPVTLYSEAGSALLAAMQTTGVERLVVVTAGAYVHSSRSPLAFRMVVQPVILSLLKEAYADMRRLEARLEASTTKWTVVRPARLYDGPRRTVRTAVDDAVPNGWFVSRASLATFLLDCVNKNLHLGDRVSIAE
jgi:putative NADH-flavin reductase